MPRSTNYTVLSLLLISLCSCKDMRWRKLPEEKDIVFEGTVKKPQKSAYRPGQAKDIQLHLTSSDAEAKEAKFKILSAKLADGSNADIDYDSLKLGPNTLHYTPQEPGTHTLTLTVAVEGEEGSAKTIPCTLEAPAAEWQVAGRADDAGNLTLTINNVPEELYSEPWRIQSTRWSRGLLGSIVNSPRQVQYGENTLAITLQAVALEELPQVHFNLQGPDRAFQSITLDLREVCVARLEETYSEDQIQTIRVHNETVRQQVATYQGNYTGAPRAEAQRELRALHETTTHLQEQTNQKLEQLINNLNILRNQEALDLTVLDTRRNDFEHELAALNVSMNILQPMVNQLSESNTGPIDPWGVLHEGLQQGQYDEASMAAHLASPLLSDAINREGEQGKTLLHLAIEQGHVALSRSLLNQGAAVNVRALSGNTPLHYATEANNQEAISLLLGAGAEQNFPPDWQLQGNYEAAGQQLILTIGDTPGRTRQARDPQAQWRITNTSWSEGLSGQIDPNTVLRHGENRIPVIVTMTTLTEQPRVQILLQGPDRAYQRITLDLREVCVARLQEGERGLTEREDNVNEYVQDTDTIYQLPQETVTDPRVNREKQNEVETLLRQLEAFQRQYQGDLQAFASNLDTLDQTQVNENLPVLQANNNRLKDAIASLKSAQVQLRQQRNTAHEALFKTLDNENQQAVDMLLEDPKLDVNERNRNDESFLTMATKKRNFEAMERILERGGTRGINTIIWEYNKTKASTPLNIAVFNNRPNIVRLLLQNGADVHHQDTAYETRPIHDAVWTNKPEIVSILLENGARINEQALNKTPLMMAVHHQCMETVEILIQRRAHLHMRNRDGQTALDIARNRANTNIVTLLERAGAR